MLAVLLETVPPFFVYAFFALATVVFYFCIRGTSIETVVKATYAEISFGLL